MSDRALDSKAVARIAALSKTPGWEDLTAWLVEIDDKYWHRLMVQMQGPDAKPVDQREVDFARGIQHGIRHLLMAPTKAAKIYERQTQEAPVEN